jgi:transcriptional regulator with XRE-family HTH domain
MNEKKIAELMESKGWSVSQLARECGKSKSIISRVLNHQVDDVALSTAVAIADALGVSVDGLVKR